MSSLFFFSNSLSYKQHINLRLFVLIFSYANIFSMRCTIYLFKETALCTKTD